MPDFLSVALTVLFCFALILAALAIVSRRLSWFARYRAPLIGVIMALGIAVYSVGYLSAPENGPGVAGLVSAGLRALFSAGRMFVLENDIGELGSVTSSPVFLLCFGAVMAAAMLAMLVVTLSFFGYRFFCAVRIRFIRLFGSSRDVYVFSALNPASLMLAEDIRKESETALLAFLVGSSSEPDEKSLEKQAAAENHILIPCPAQMKKLEHFGFYRSMKGTLRFLAMGDSHAGNARLAVALSSLLDGQLRKRTALYVLLDTERYRELFYREDFKDLEVIAVDRAELASRLLMDRLPPVACIKEQPVGDGSLSGSLTAAIVGYGETGPHLLRHIATQGQSEGLSLRLLAMDGGIGDKAALFMQRNPQVSRCAELTLLDITPCSEAFFRYFAEHLHEMDYIVCACPQDETSAAAAAELQRMASRLGLTPRICAYLRDGGAAPLLFSEGELQKITVFGEDRELYTVGLVIHETLDRMARAVHEYYREPSTDGRDWDRLSHYEKQSCRALALHIPAKLFSVGLRLGENADTCAYDELLAHGPGIVENLSKGEHLRWNAHLFTNGWTQLPFDGVYAGKDLQLRRHSCLTDWDSLASLSAAAGQDFQQYDIHLIDHLGSIVRSAGFGIIPVGDGTE